VKRVKRCGFPSNFGTLLALDGFVIKIKKPTTKSLGGKEVTPHFNRKGYYALIAQVGVDSDGRVVFVSVNWPGSTNDICCFRETKLYEALRDKSFPGYMHIICNQRMSSSNSNTI
jgi:DDE superfamily endonuclease